MSAEHNLGAPGQNLAQNDHINPLDSIMSNPPASTIRGFHIDAQNIDPFALNFDTTSVEEQKRRRDRLARFEGTAAVQQLDYIEEQDRKAKSRLDRFVNQDTHVDTDENPLVASITHSFPSIMPFEQIHLIPDAETQYELRGFNPSAPRRFDTIHLFGSRLLLQRVRTEDLLNRYRADGLIRVEWQSDYRCNLVFTDKFSARRVLDQESYVRDLDVAAAARHFPLQDPSKSEEENAVSFDPAVLPFLVWRQSVYSEDDGQAKGSLSFRLATTYDIKEPIEERKHSQFYLENDKYFNDLLGYRKQRALEAKLAEEKAHVDQEVAKPAPKPVIIPKLDVEAPLPARPVIVKEEVISRGRGFAKGRVGAFDIDRPVVERARGAERDSAQNHGRQRDRNYGPQLHQPKVERDTPLVVTTQHIKAIGERREQLQQERLERQAVRELRAQNNPMARRLLTKEEQLELQQRETEESGRVHSNVTYNPSLSSLQRQSQLETPASGLGLMFAVVLPQDEEEKRIKQEQERIRAEAREEERKKREAEKAARSERFQAEEAEKEAQRQAEEAQQRELQAQQEALLAQQRAEQNALLEQQAQAEAAMGGHQMVDSVAAEADDYA